MENSTYIIAEIGINHNGSLENCFKMIDAAADAGCQAAKFQTFSAKYLYPRSAGRLDWKTDKESYDYDIYDAVKSFELPLEWIDELIPYCRERKLDFMSSVFDVKGLDFLLGKGMAHIKLSSYTITHLPLIKACAEAKLPIIMSTGGASLGETEEAVNAVLNQHDMLSLLHCSIQYPTSLDSCNLGVIDLLSTAFPNCRVGLSDHTAEVSDAPVQAVALGASVIEKHITLDRRMAGPDHFFALEPEDLKTMVTDIRAVENSPGIVIDREMYGSSAKVCHAHEQYMRDFCYMTLFAGKDIKKGEVIRPEDLMILRPGKKRQGLPPKMLDLFSVKDGHITARRDIRFEDPITWNCILG